MITLGGKVVAIKDARNALRSNVLRVTSITDYCTASRDRSAYLIQEDNPPRGFAAYLMLEGGPVKSSEAAVDGPIVVLSRAYDYLDNGDLVTFSPDTQRVRVLYRRKSPHNNFLVTERCDNYCLMCSQPPKDIDDDWIVSEILEAIPMIDPETPELGFTGGEPTLLGERLIEVLRRCKECLPNTAVHVLSNGRKFSDLRFTRAWASVEHHDLMAGIPIYADVSTIHDYVVQADGAFDETIRGILNLKRLGQRVEIRVVLHRQTYKHLARLAEFISRNLVFVDHVALMGLEIMGFTRANLDILWIDPIEYQQELVEAVKILDSYRMKVSIYNHQLCLLDRSLWPFAVKSISDWKNEYIEECFTCEAREQCGGCFHSAKYKRSTHIHPIKLRLSETA